MSTMPTKTPSKGTLEGTRKHPCKCTLNLNVSQLSEYIRITHFAIYVGVLCQQRKVKCDRNEPCANCVKSRIECVSPSTLPPKKRKKRFPEAELLARLRRYEDHLRVSGICALQCPVFGSALSDPSSRMVDS